MSVLIVRSRSDSDIESTSAEKIRKEEMLGKTSKSRLTRTASAIGAPRARVSPPNAPKRSGAKKLSTVVSNTQFSAFFLIKNLDTGKEFIVKEYGENGAWNRLSDLQTGKQLTMEEFEKSVGFSSIVKDLMRRDNANSAIDLSKLNSYVSKSLRESKKRGAAFLKNIKGVAHSMSSKAPPEKEKDPNVSSLRVVMVDQHQQQEKNNDETNQWVKVRHSGKSHKELSALHLCQEIEAHQGAIWTMKFSPDSHLLASGGEDCAIHVWEVQECEILSTNESSLTPIQEGDDAAEVPPEKKKKGKAPSIRKGNQIPDYVHAPETVFSLSDKPICSFTGHLDDVLDLSWSRSQLLLSSSKDKTVRLWDIETQSCLKLFAHNDYDVSVAIPWHGVVKGEPPPAQTQPKKNPKKPSTTTTQENATAGKKSGLPPLPKKNNDNTESVATEEHQEDEPTTQVPQNETENNAGETIKPGDSPSISISSRISSWSWFDGSGSHGTHLAQPTAWGMVIVTATIGGQIRAYQNFGLPRRVSRQGSLF
ncbi:hypothetical protein F2Q68_00000062 [Brassica cretica]|uniref:Anaphase-promoting complex subunit 4 WD40 domain-containing protein n=1 Tax=Brassica cretica TaxID=69181 RepID=A0A8S9JCY1_BRACR|nr:hypothetical protein F2Q68_00000062 [Brassica cretica]